MLRTITKEPEEVWKENGYINEHTILLDEKVLLEVDECINHHITKWPTNLLSMKGYEMVLEIYEVLKRPHFDPTVSLIFRKEHLDIPLEKFLFFRKLLRRDNI